MPCLIVFLTVPIAIALESILGHLNGTFLEWFQNNIKNVEMVCSITVIKQTFLWDSSREVIDACSRKVLEQAIRIFLKLF